MSLELLTVEESKAKPAGTGRNKPNTNPVLDEPQYVWGSKFPDGGWGGINRRIWVQVRELGL